jgi:putative ABC transport system ATP-binding protein
MIELQHINKSFYRNTANEIHALQDINLHISKGEFVVIVGSNGSGKTSLLNAIAGDIRADGGSVWIDSNNVTGLKEFQRSRWIARVFQDPLSGTASGLSILENFRLASLRTRKKKIVVGTNENFRAQVKERIATLNLGLENKTEQQMGTLSGGQRQALTLLMAVMDEPKVLLLDEPAAALDPKTSNLVMKLAEKIIAEFQLTAILVTHQMKDVLQFGNRLIMLEQGKITRDLNGAEKSGLQLADVHSWFD